jgi:LysM repeat protein
VKLIEQSFASPLGVIMAAIIVPSRISEESSSRPTARVYAMRRLVAAGLSLALVFVLGQMVSSAVTATPAQPSRTPGASVHVVQPGESLWSIAQQERPRADMARLVDELLRLNGSATIRVGQELILPN